MGVVIVSANRKKGGRTIDGRREGMHEKGKESDKK